MGWLNFVGGTLVVLLVPITLLYFVFRVFYGSEVTLKQASAIVAGTFLAVGILTQSLTMAVMALKDDWNINPQEALQASPGLLLDPQTASKPLPALLNSFDLFTFWTVFLLATGFGIAIRKTTASALWGVGACWALWILCKVGWTAIF